MAGKLQPVPVDLGADRLNGPEVHMVKPPLQRRELATDSDESGPNLARHRPLKTRL